MKKELLIQVNSCICFQNVDNSPIHPSSSSARSIATATDMAAGSDEQVSLFYRSQDCNIYIDVACFSVIPANRSDLIIVPIFKFPDRKKLGFSDFHKKNKKICLTITINFTIKSTFQAQTSHSYTFKNAKIQDLKEGSTCTRTGVLPLDPEGA